MQTVAAFIVMTIDKHHQERSFFEKGLDSSDPLEGTIRTSNRRGEGAADSSFKPSGKPETMSTKQHGRIISSIHHDPSCNMETGVLAQDDEKKGHWPRTGDESDGSQLMDSPRRSGDADPKSIKAPPRRWEYDTSSLDAPPPLSG